MESQSAGPPEPRTFGIISGLVLYIVTHHADVFAPSLHLDKRLVCCVVRQCDPPFDKSYCRDTWKGAWDLTRWDNPDKGTFVL